MLGRLPAFLSARLFAALLLVAIGLQAAQSFDAAPRSIHGSAFSAATSEVALAPQRRNEAAQTAIALLPLAVLPPPTPVVVPPIQTALPAPRPDSTGPPARATFGRKPPPRAPPIA